MPVTVSSSCSTHDCVVVPVGAALVSSFLDSPLPQDCVVFGEVSLSGEVRQVGRMEARLKEAAKLGFSRALAAPAAAEGSPFPVVGLTRLADAVRLIGEERWG